MVITGTVFVGILVNGNRGCENFYTDSVVTEQLLPGIVV